MGLLAAVHDPLAVALRRRHGRVGGAGRRVHFAGLISNARIQRNEGGKAGLAKRSEEHSILKHHERKRGSRVVRVLSNQSRLICGTVSHSI